MQVKSVLIGFCLSDCMFLMPLRFGPSDLHLRAQKGLLTTDRVPSKKAAETTRIEAIRQSLVSLRESAVGRMKEVLDRVTDPLTVGGTAVLAFSLTMMMRGEIMKKIEQDNRVAAVAKAEADARAAKLVPLIEALENAPEIVAGNHDTYYIEISNYHKPQHLYISVDVRPEHLPTVLNHLRSQGIPVDTVLLTDPKASGRHEITRLNPKENEADWIRVETLEDVTRSHNLDQMNRLDDDGKRMSVPTGRCPKQMAECVEKFAPEGRGQPKNHVAVIIRNPKGEKEMPHSFVDEIRRRAPHEISVVHVSRHVPQNVKRGQVVNQPVAATPPVQTVVATEKPMAPVTVESNAEELEEVPMPIFTYDE